MNLREKIERSKSRERIDFSQIGCTNQDDPLVLAKPSGMIIIEPVWTLAGDFEGGMYADYIAEHPEYNGVYVRSGLLERLEKAASLLDRRYKLVVRAGHRPLAVQKRLLKECMEDYMADHPDVSKREALEHARTFVSDPDTSLPPHCCGAPVDVDVLESGADRLVDFGSPVNVDDDISYLHYEGISGIAKENRLMLLGAMLDAGLASTPFEWWHFSYGDQVWAWFYGHRDSLYSPVDV